MQICEELGIEDVNVTNMGKKEFKAEATEACLVKDEETQRRLASKSKKCERIMADDFGKKEYFSQQSISKARKYFCTRQCP